MKKIVKFALAGGAALALAACGSSDDAATEAEADTVEIPAEDAVADVEEAPVADAGAVATTPEDTDPATPSAGEQATAEEAGAMADDVAARVKAAQAAAERATDTAEQTMAENPVVPAAPVPAN